MTRPSLLACALVAGALAVSSDAHAFKYLCNGVDAFGNVRSDSCSCTASNAQRWEDGFIDWRIKRAGTNQIPSGEWLTVATASLQAWNNVGCSDFIQRDLGDVANPDFNGNEAQHTIWWISSASQYQDVVGGGVQDTLGVTLSPYYILGSCAQRSTSDSDIVMNNAGGAQWTTNMANCEGNCVNVQSTLVHELGHALGLGHPCTNNEQVGDSCPAGGSIMAAISDYREDINNPLQDDTNGICNLYPGAAPGSLGSSCTAGSQCDSSLCVTDNGVQYCSQACGTCPTGFRCTNAQCTRAIPQTGEACTGSCAPGNLCLGSSGSKICYLECNATNGTGCTGGDRCADLGQGVGACVPPGSRQPGERCETEGCVNGASCYILDSQNDCSAQGQCGSGLICDVGGTGKCISAYCIQDCTTATDCASDQQCYNIAQGANGCIGARMENAVCGETDPYILSACAENLQCVGSGSGYTCFRDCTTSNSCLMGQRCVTLSDNMTRICLQERLDGQTCEGDCGSGLICVQDTIQASHCFVDCGGNGNCPFGKYCNAYTNFSICQNEQASTGSSSSSGASGSGSTSSSSGGASSGGTSSGGSGNPNGTKADGEDCAVGSECQSGNCTSTGNSRICTSLCDPRLGHYECPENWGCVPNNDGDLSQGGVCIPGQIGGGETGSACTTGAECKYGICSQRQCTIWCTEDGSCGSNLEAKGYTCDTSVVTPGTCKPGEGGAAGAPACSCATTLPSVPAASLALLGLLGLLSTRRRRG